MNAWVIPAIAIAFAIGTLIFKLGGWAAGVNADRKGFREFMEGVNADRREFRDFMEEVRGALRDVRDDIKDILGKIEHIMGRLPSAETGAGSPLRLTELGKRISKTLGGRAWARETAATVADRAEGKQPYEIQKLSADYVTEEFQPAAEFDAQINACAYEEGIKREQVLNVLATELRDVLLARSGHPVPRARSGSEPSLHSA